jgi:hypothetical protein
MTYLMKKNLKALKTFIYICIYISLLHVLLDRDQEFKINNLSTIFFFINKLADLYSM